MAFNLTNVLPEMTKGQELTNAANKYIRTLEANFNGEVLSPSQQTNNRLNDYKKYAKTIRGKLLSNNDWTAGFLVRR